MKAVRITVRDRHNYIYGAGDYGLRLYTYIKEMNLAEVDGFVQTRRSDNETEIDGVSLYGYEEITDVKNSIFFIAINDKNSMCEIKTKITMDGGIAYDWSDFIRSNLMYEQKRFCIICGRNVKKFSVGGIQSEIFKKHKIIGGGKRENCVCPNCGSVDRHRWFYFCLMKHTNIITEKVDILHFAPEKMISDKIITRNSNCKYYTADLDKGNADIEIDITDIPFRDGIFDYVIANHVLEHVSDEQSAINEMKRVLKDTGNIILSFPICMDFDTIQDDSIVTAEGRLNAFGQEDHVRLYGRDYLERLEKYGLKIREYRPRNELNDEMIEYFGLSRDDTILICKKINRL